jgi:hypothetical protein
MLRQSPAVCANFSERRSARAFKRFGKGETSTMTISTQKVERMLLVLKSIADKSRSSQAGLFCNRRAGGVFLLSV